MKTLLRLLFAIWLLLLTLTQVNIIDGQVYTNLTLRGVVIDVTNLQLDSLHERQQKKGLPLQ
jgi:hypothetical protein